MPRDGYLDVVVAAADDLAARGHPFPTRVVLAELAAHVGAALGTTADGLPLSRWRESIDVLAPPPVVAPELLGEAFEVLIDRGARKRSGAVFTPRQVTASMVDVALDLVSDGRAVPSVCDPAAGGGAFLLAAARWSIDNGGDPAAVIGSLCGVDVDPLAIDVAGTAVGLLGRTHGCDASANLVVGDALTGVTWEEIVPRNGFDVVVGNPPFLNQLARDTAHTMARRVKLHTRFGHAAGGYADVAYLFVHLALDITRPGGAIGLVLPESFLAARDARPARDEIAARARLQWMWRSIDRVFRADVRVVAPVMSVGEPARQGKVRRAVGVAFAELAPLDLEAAQLTESTTWSWLFADLAGTPSFEVRSATALGDFCHATADFRDQYYGLKPHVFDPGDRWVQRSAPLVTVGLIDPARCRWGTRSVRFAKQSFARPAIDLDGLATDPKLAVWATSRLVPKVLLATQSRVLEAVVDERGAWLPSTPVITIEAEPDRLWHVAAALVSPVLTAWTVRHYAGAALSPDAIKLSARQVLALPAPAPGTAWDAAADAFRAAQGAADDDAWLAQLTIAGRAMGEAYGVEPADNDRLTSWWLDRLPRRGGSPR